jgi:hypothetical protein
LKIGTSSEGIYPALPSEGGYTANAIVNTAYGYPYFTINENPNISLATEEQPYAARILGSQYGDFLGGGTGSAGYWAEWAEGSTANRQNWARSLTAAGSRHALLNYSTSSEFRKITAEAFLDRKVGLQFDCKNELIVEPLIPQVKLTYCADFVNGTVYSNGTIIFNYTVVNSNNMEYWITDQMEVEVSDGRKLYRYRPEAIKWKSGTNYGQFKISGFTSQGIDGKAYTVTFRMLNYYGKVISGSELSIAFTHRYADLPNATNSLTDCASVLGYIPDPNATPPTTPSFRFGTNLATGVPGEGDTLPTDIETAKEYWDQKIKERDDWFWQLGKDDTMPLFQGSEDCDPLGLKTFWKPGSMPFGMPKDDPFTPKLPYLPLGGRNHHLPTEIPPEGLQPKYVNDNDGTEIYYHDGRWWIRTIKFAADGSVIVTWRFKIPKTSPDNFGPFDHPSDSGWTVFVPCYGVPVCFSKNILTGEYQVSPYTFQDPMMQDWPIFWSNPLNYPPGWYEGQPNPYDVPNNNPIAPFMTNDGWRPVTVPSGRDADGDPYRGRGWDPTIGPYYVDPDRGIRPYGVGGVDAGDHPESPGYFFTDRKLEHPPCKNGGNSPGIAPPNPATAQGLDDSVPGL